MANKDLTKMTEEELKALARELGKEYYPTLPQFSSKQESLHALDVLLSQKRSKASLIKDIKAMQRKLGTPTLKVVASISEEKSKLVNNFANYTAKEVASIYADAQRQLKNTIYSSMEKSDWTMAEFTKFKRDVTLYNEINGQLEALGKKTEELMAKNISVVCKDTVLTDAYFLEQFSAKSTNLKILNMSMLKEVAETNWSGLVYSERIWRDVEQLKYILREQIMQAVILGEGNKKIAKRINDIMGRGAYNASRLARTEVIAASSRVQKAFAKDNPDIVDKMEWVAYIDSRTSKECMLHNGEVKTVEEWETSSEQIPCHPNCRCSYVMVVNDKYKIKKDIQPFEDWLAEKREAGEIIDGAGWMNPKKPKA